MSARVLYGASFNALSLSTITSPFSDGDFPIQRLFDYRADTDARFLAGANRAFVADTGVIIAAAGQDWVSLHGHNLDVGMQLHVETSNDPTFATGVTSRVLFVSPVAQVVFFQFPALVGDQYWRFTFVGTNSVPIQVGELVLGHTLALSRFPEKSWSVEFLENNESQLAGGNEYDSSRASGPQRIWKGQLGTRSDAERLQLAQWLADMKAGVRPSIFCPNDAEEFCFLGRVRDRWDRTLDGVSAARRYTWPLTFVEDPLIYADAQ